MNTKNIVLSLTFVGIIAGSAFTPVMAADNNPIPSGATEASTQKQESALLPLAYAAPTTSYNTQDPSHAQSHTLISSSSSSTTSGAYTPQTDADDDFYGQGQVQKNNASSSTTTNTIIAHTDTANSSNNNSLVESTLDVFPDEIIANFAEQIANHIAPNYHLDLTNKNQRNDLWHLLTLGKTNRYFKNVFVPEALRHIHSITISNDILRRPGLLNFLGKLKKSTTIDINLSGTDITDQQLEALLAKIDRNKIFSLNLSYCYSLQNPTLNLPKLTKLDLSSCRELQNPTINCPTLITLDLSICHKLKNPTINCPALITLNLSYCYSLQNLTLNHPTLTKLNLSFCRELQNPTINCPTLITLDLSSCHKLKNPTINCPALITLDLNLCDSLQNLTLNSPALTELDLFGCTQPINVTLQATAPNLNLENFKQQKKNIHFNYINKQ
jgi:hypothetical protein